MKGFLQMLALAVGVWLAAFVCGYGQEAARFRVNRYIGDVVTGYGALLVWTVLPWLTLGVAAAWMLHGRPLRGWMPWLFLLAAVLAFALMFSLRLPADIGGTPSVVTPPPETVGAELFLAGYTAVAYLRQRRRKGDASKPPE